jgi:integral membrane sensor domain MASE1
MLSSVNFIIRQAAFWSRKMNPSFFILNIWPGQTIQSVGAIWFGGWGVIAAIVFPFFTGELSGGGTLPALLLYIPADLMQSLIPGWSLRYFKADPRLVSRRDWLIWLVWGAILPGLLSAAWSAIALRLSGDLGNEYFNTAFLILSGSRIITTILVGSLLLKFGSALVIKTKVFCKGFWA